MAPTTAHAPCQARALSRPRLSPLTPGPDANATPGGQEEGPRLLGDKGGVLLGVGAAAQALVHGEAQLGQLGGVHLLLVAAVAAVLALQPLARREEADAQPAALLPAQRSARLGLNVRAQRGAH